MADSKPPRPPGTGGFSDLIDQLKQLPDDLRDAVEQALSGEGSARPELSGLDLLVAAMRAQGATPADLAGAFPARQAAQPLAPPDTYRGATPPASASPVPQQPPPRRPEPAAPQEPPPRGPQGPAGPGAGTPPPPPPPRRPEPAGLPDLPDLGDLRPRRPIADAARLMADPALGPARPAPVAPDDSAGHRSYRPTAGWSWYDPPPWSGSRSAGSAPPDPSAGGSGRGAGEPPPTNPPPPPPGGPDNPRRKAPDLEDLLAATLQVLPRPVADGFASALGKAEGFRRAASAIGGLAEAAGLAGAGGAAAGAAAAVPGVGTALFLATEGLKYARQKINEFTDDAELQTARNRPLAAFNGGIATAYTELAMGDLRRNFRVADETSKSTAALARATDRMRDGWVDLEVMQTEFGNRWAGFKAGVSGGIGERTSPLWQAGSAAMRTIDPEGNLLEKLGRGLVDGAYWSAPALSVPMEVLKMMGFEGANGDPAVARFQQGWHQELANIFHGGQVRRHGFVVQPRPREVLRRQDRVRRFNEALRDGRRDAVDFNQRQGLPGFIL